MKSMSEMNVAFFLRDYLSIKSGEKRIDLEKFEEVELFLQELSQELESSGYVLNVIVSPRDFYTEEDLDIASEEDRHVTLDLEAFHKEIRKG